LKLIQITNGRSCLLNTT